MIDIKDLVDKISRLRTYAGFRETFNKRRKELQVVEDLVESMSSRGEALYHSPKCSDKDPPDCIVKDLDGNNVGVEVKELVDQKAIEKVEKGINITRLWGKNEVIEEIKRILKEKDSKTYHGKYSKIILIIHTDEVSIQYEDILPTIEQHLFSPLNQISEVYLLFSYHPPLREKYPYIQLNVARL